MSSVMFQPTRKRLNTVKIELHCYTIYLNAYSQVDSLSSPYTLVSFRLNDEGMIGIILIFSRDKISGDVRYIVGETEYLAVIRYGMVGYITIIV